MLFRVFRLNHIQQRYFICWYHILLILVLCAKYQNPHFHQKTMRMMKVISFILFQLDDQIPNFAISVWNDQKNTILRQNWSKLTWSQVKLEFSSNLIIFHQYNIDNLESFFFLKFNQSLLWSTQTWFKINWNQTVQ